MRIKQHISFKLLTIFPIFANVKSVNNITKKIAVLLISCVVLIISFNSTFYIHYHTLGNGSVITHSHPYDRTGDSSPIKKHDHNRLEMALISSLSLLIMTSLIVMVAVGTSLVITVFTLRENLLTAISPHTTGRSPPQA